MKKRIVISILLFLTAIVVFKNAAFIADFSIIKGGTEYDCPIFMTVGENGNRYIINKSMTQVLVLDKNNNYQYAINGGSSIKTFNFVNNITVDSEGNVYASDVEYNSNYDRDKGFRIIKFSPTGKYEDTIYECEYEEGKMPYIHSCCMSLDNKNGRIYFAQREFEEIVMYSIASDGSEEELTVEHTYPYDNAKLLVFDIAMDLNNDFIYFTDKKGNIFKADDSGVSEVYMGGVYSEDIDFYEVPNCIALSSDSQALYYTDIGRREVFEIEIATGQRRVIFERDYNKPLDECSLYYRIGVNKSVERGFATCSSGDDSNIVVYDGKNVDINRNFIMPSVIRGKYILLMVLSLILLAAVIIFIKKKITSALTGKNGETVMMYILVFVSIFTIFTITTVILLNNTNSRYNDRVRINTYYLASIVSQFIDGDTLEKIDSPDDYMNDDYIEVRNQLHDAFAQLPTDMESLSRDTDNTTYCTLYKVKNNVVYYTMHLSDDDGVIYPDEYTYEDSDYKLVKDTMRAHSFNGITTADGRWLFTVAPITNSAGEMVALCEVGLNLVSYEEADKRVIKEILICVGSLTIAIFLLISEFVNLITIMKKYDEEKSKNRALPVDFIRMFAFLIYMADNFTAVIIPLMSEKLYTDTFPIVSSIAIALPLAAQALSASVMGFLAGHIIERIGNRKSFIAGIVFHIIGLTLCAFSTSLYLFIISMFVVGIGMGINIVCMNTFVVQHDGDSSEGFSMLTVGTFGGTNCGIVIGTVVSERSGYSLVFLISAVVALIMLFIVRHFYKRDIDEYTYEEKTSEKSEISMVKFVFNIKIFSYMLFALVPYYIFASFVFYFIPIYANSQGITESGIGLITLAYGMVTAYLSNFTTQNIVERFGARLSIAAASIITALSLVVFIIDPSITSLILIVMIMGFADSFGYPALSVYFSERKQVELYGEGKAMGIYNTFQGIAETIAPMVFGMALAFGERRGMIILGGAFVICALVFTALSMEKGVKQSIKNKNEISK